MKIEMLKDTQHFSLGLVEKGTVLDIDPLVGNAWVYDGSAKQFIEKPIEAKANEGKKTK